MLKRESLRRWDFSKAFITSLMIHAILIFGLGFTLFQIQERFDPQRVVNVKFANANFCLLYTSPRPRDGLLSRMPSSA